MKQNQNTLHSEKLLLENKTFFLDLKKAKNGNSYLTITQSKRMEDEQYERIKIVLFEEELQAFNTAFAKVLEAFKPNPGTVNREEYIAKIRKNYPMAFHPWAKEEEELLIAMFNEGKEKRVIAGALRRQESAIIARLMKLGLTSSVAA